MAAGADVSSFASSFVHEQWQIGMLMYQKDIKNWEKDPLLFAKAMVKNLLKKVGIDDVIVFEKTDMSSFHPKKQAAIFCQSKKI